MTGEPVVIVHLMGTTRGTLCGERVVQITDENCLLARYLCPGCLTAVRRSRG